MVNTRDAAVASLLVYGWYDRGNLGDDLMKVALERAFSARNVRSRFVDRIDEVELASAHGVVVGGGSILFDEPDVSPGALALLLAQKIPVFYVGVGVETSIHPVHQELMKVARVVAARDRDMPDLVFSLPVAEERVEAHSRSVLVIPNIETVPTWCDPHWKHLSWARFKDEFAQVLDHLVDTGCPVSFMLMCSNPCMEDAWAAGELMAHMRRRNKPRVLVHPGREQAWAALVDTVREHAIVVTQRYHGIIVAEAAGVPYVSIDHHDKLKNALPRRGSHLAYSGIRKDELIVAIDDSLGSTISPHRVPQRVYDELIDRIVGVIMGQHSDG